MKLTVEGVALELDMLDAGQNEVAAAAFDRLAARMRALRDEGAPGGVPEGIRAQCGAIFDCFDEIFGDGTAGRIFGGKCQLRRALRAFEKLSRAAARQQKDFVDEVEAALAKYDPERVG